MLWMFLNCTSLPKGMCYCIALQSTCNYTGPNGAINHNKHFCYLWTGSIINITAEYNGEQIHLKWTVPSRDECKEIETFIIEWNNIQKPHECNGQESIKVMVKIKVLVLGTVTVDERGIPTEKLILEIHDQSMSKKFVLKWLIFINYRQLL